MDQLHQKIKNMQAIILLLLVLLILSSCESTQEIKVGLLWRDDTHFNNTGKRYLGMVEGEYDLGTGFDGSVLEIMSVNPGENKTHLFSFSSNSSSHYTAFIFIDVDSSETYDDGYDIISGYKYNYGEPGERLNISVSAFY